MVPQQRIVIRDVVNHQTRLPHYPILLPFSAFNLHVGSQYYRAHEYHAPFYGGTPVLFEDLRDLFFPTYLPRLRQNLGK